MKKSLRLLTLILGLANLTAGAASSPVQSPSTQDRACIHSTSVAIMAT